MQLCCVLKEESTYQQYLRSILAVWLAMLFVGNAAFQVFHNHEHATSHKHYDHTSVQKLVKSCEACDYLAHHQFVPILTANHFELMPQVKSPSVHAGRYYIGGYKFTLQGFTNKGPPAYLA